MYKFFGSEYEIDELLPVLKQNIELLQKAQLDNIKQLADIKPTLEQVIVAFRENGIVETDDERAHREKMEGLVKQSTQEKLTRFIEQKQKESENFDTLVAAVEHDVVAIKTNNSYVQKLFELVEDYVSNKKCSLMISLIHNIDDLIGNNKLAHVYDCFMQAYNHFAK